MIAITPPKDFEITTSPSIGKVVDLFCGVGGLAHGFKLEGFDIAAGIDLDGSCKFAFETNNDAPFIQRDVASLLSSEVNELYDPNLPKVLVGCAPCQPFSSYNQKNDDPSWKLLEHFGRLVEEIKPDVVSMENVARLQVFNHGEMFNRFVLTLEKNGYWVSHKVVFAPDYGVPQQRTRLVLLASRLGPIELSEPTHTKNNHPTVREVIEQLPSIQSGETHPSDPLHTSSTLSELNMKRIKASKPGGTWRDWDPDLVAECHKDPRGRGYASVYGRMEWDSPSPTITTQFYGLGNGRFGHPDQNRAISLREGAILQSFPPTYQFFEPDSAVRIKTIGRLIGNAVPVKLGMAIARSIANHLNSIEVYGK